MSFKRIASFCRDVLHIPISQGSIKNMLNRVTRKSLPLYERIRYFIQLSEELGGDETGDKLNGDKKLNKSRDYIYEFLYYNIPLLTRMVPKEPSEM